MALLIGNELAELSRQHNYHIYLCASGELARLYEIAAKALGVKYHMIDETEMANAVIKGQAKVFGSIKLN